MTVDEKADVPGLVARHHQSDDYLLLGVGLEKRGGRVTVDFGIKHFVDHRKALQAVEKPFSAVVVPLFPCVLMVCITVGAGFALFRSLDEGTVAVQQADAVVGEEYKFTKRLYSPVLR